MGVVTDADEKIDEARDSSDKALKALNEIVVNECFGHDDYNDEFTQKIHKAHSMLIQIRKLLTHNVQ